MITITVRAFERVGTMFPLFYFKSRRIDLKVQFATPWEISVILVLAWAITFDTFQTLNPIHKSRISPLPAVFALRSFRVYVCSADGSNVASNIETPID